jgi:hypothetical protein
MAGDRRLSVTGVVAGVLILIAVIVVAIILFWPAKPKTEPSSTLSVPIERAKNIQCLTQLRKVTAAIQMSAAENGKYPGRLQDLDVLSGTDLICPVSNRAYRYDSISGRVSCPGHD